jgi:nitroreductase
LTDPASRAPESVSAPVFEAIRANIAVRDFKDEPIEDGHLFRILEAGRLCQSGKNLQPWYFIVVRNRSALVKLSEFMKGDVDEQRLREAALAVAVISDPISEFHIVDAGRVIQNMTLAAWELGIGSTMISGLEPPNRDSSRDSIKRFLRVPENLNLVDLVVFGYRKRQRLVKQKRRKELEKLVYGEFFGNPLILKQPKM